MTNRISAAMLFLMSMVLAPYAFASCAPKIKSLSATNADMLSSHFPDAECSSYIGEAGAEAYFCQWKFAYRAPDADLAFQDMFVALSQCFDPARLPSNVDMVNHPDSYVLKVFEAQNRFISIALKDKAALKSTFVFLRAEPTP